MKALFYTSSEIGEDNILWGLIELSIDVDVSETVVELDKKNHGQIETIASESKNYDFTITRNFSINVAEGCHISGTPYISWCYDSPVMALLSFEAFYPTNYIFVFDKKHQERLKEIGLRQVFYQPLAANMAKANLVTITNEDIALNMSEISFIGNMYEYGLYKKFRSRSQDDIINDCENLFNKHMCRWDKNDSIFNELGDSTIHYLYSLIDKNEEQKTFISERYLTEMLVLVYEMTSRERYSFLDSIGKRFQLVVHTRQPERLEGKIAATILPPLDQLSDNLYKTYSAAKINLNLTMRSIETGVPQRVFDIMSIGGCVFSNYQEEAEELFEPDKEIVLFKSIEEFKDKADYYLTHENERIKVCLGGYKRVNNCYTYPLAISNMIKILPY